MKDAEPKSGSQLWKMNDSPRLVAILIDQDSHNALILNSQLFHRLRVIIYRE